MTLLPKSAWGDGPWQSEPDEARWTDDATGLPCYAFRSGISGTWCGYVGVDHDHPAFGLSYHGDPNSEPDNEEPSPLFEGMRRIERFLIEWRRDAHEMAKARPQAQTFLNNINVHGELTYSGSLSADPTLHWFGFDTCHAWDFQPAMDATMRLSGWRFGPATGDQSYRTLDYVKEQCTHLARQLADIAATIAQRQL